MADDPFNYSGKLALLAQVARDARLPRTAVAVYSVLIDYANMRTGVAYPSVVRIGKEAGVPKTTALRGLKRLEECGWIQVERKFGASSTYTLTGSDSVTGSEGVTGATSDETGATSNLRRGRTGHATGTGPVPTVTPEQKKALKSNKTTGTHATDAGAIPVQTEQGRACLLMRQAGCSQSNSSHPGLIAALGEGVTPEVLADTAREAVESGKGHPFAWAIATARGRHAAGAAPVAAVEGHEPHRRLSAVERVEANIARARQERGEPIEGEAVRVTYRDRYRPREGLADRVIRRLEAHAAAGHLDD